VLQRGELCTSARLFLTISILHATRVTMLECASLMLISVMIRRYNRLVSLQHQSRVTRHSLRGGVNNLGSFSDRHDKKLLSVARFFPVPIGDVPPPIISVCASRIKLRLLLLTWRALLPYTLLRYTCSTCDVPSLSLSLSPLSSASGDVARVCHVSMY